jgi:hypothetical protein
MTPRQIATNQAAVVCDVCGRTLLRGEEASVFLAGGARRVVCELCTPRAANEGWIREGVEQEELGMRSRGREGRGSFLSRLRSRREVGHETVVPEAEVDEPDFEPVPAAPPPVPEPVREPRHVHAVPTNADMKRSRALDVFNASEHPRTVAALARSLGAPIVTVRPSETEGSIVTIVVGWELTWYRYEVDLADEAAGVRVTGQGAELVELEAADQQPNAAAGERGELLLATG